MKHAEYVTVMNQCGAYARSLKIEDIFTTSWGGDYTPRLALTDISASNRIFPVVYQYEVWNTITNVQSSGEVSIGEKAWSRSEQRRFFRTDQEQTTQIPDITRIYHTGYVQNPRSRKHLQLISDYAPYTYNDHVWISSRVSSVRSLGDDYVIEPPTDYSYARFAMASVTPYAPTRQTDQYSFKANNQLIMGTSIDSKSYYILPVVCLKLSETKLGSSGAGIQTNPYEL